MNINTRFKVETTSFATMAQTLTEDCSFSKEITTHDTWRTKKALNQAVKSLFLIYANVLEIF